MAFGSLREKIDPIHTALLVIDMQNDFCAEGGYLGRKDGHVEQLQEIAPVLLKVINKARELGVKIFLIRSHYDERYLQEPLKEKLGDSRYALEGTWGADSYELKPEGSLPTLCC